MVNIPIPTLHLFLPLDLKLIELLRSLSPDDWKRPTLAKLWTVKDVAAHLLDGNFRDLALSQNYIGDPPSNIQSYLDLVEYLNRLNADWVRAMKRVSPGTLIELLEVTRQPVIDYYHSLDLWARASFSVSWAGEHESQNWFHIARMYTERWHHQQQIREAVQQQGIMDDEFFSPLIQTFMMALPQAYRDVKPTDGTLVLIKVMNQSTYEWKITYRQQQWYFTSETNSAPDTQIEMSGDIAWKLFTKAIPEKVAEEKIFISGNEDLGNPILKMTSVMA